MGFPFENLIYVIPLIIAYYAVMLIAFVYYRIQRLLSEL